MRLLLDTHALLWFVEGDARLSPGATQALVNGANEVLVSIASHWEICLKLAIGKLRLAEGWRAVVDRVMAGNRMEWLPIERRHIDGILALPDHHRDPFDRLLVAQADAEDLGIVTTDPHIARYDVPVIW